MKKLESTKTDLQKTEVKKSESKDPAQINQQRFVSKKEEVQIPIQYESVSIISSQKKSAPVLKPVIQQKQSNTIMIDPKANLKNFSYSNSKYKFVSVALKNIAK